MQGRGIEEGGGWVTASEQGGGRNLTLSDGQPQLQLADLMSVAPVPRLNRNSTYPCVSEIEMKSASSSPV